MSDRGMFNHSKGGWFGPEPGVVSPMSSSEEQIVEATGLPVTRRYEVDLTVRETYTVVVDAANAKEAAEVARYRGGEIDSWAHSDRTITGVKAVRRAEPPASVPSPPEPARDPRCVEAWPECQSGAYDPRCCRFPKSCSCEQSSPGQAG